MAREVALEKEFIHGQVLQSPALRFSFKTDNAVHHQEGIAVRQKAHHFVDVQHGVSVRNIDGIGGHLLVAVVFLLELGRKFGVRAVARLDGDDVAQDRFAAQGQVSNKVHGLVAGKFIDETHGFLAHELLAADDHGVFQAAALDEALFQQGLDVFVERKGAGRGQFLFIRFRRDNRVKVLGNAVFRPHAGDGNAELLGGENGQDGTALGFNGNGLAHFQIAARHIQFHDAGALDQLYVGG